MECPACKAKMEKGTAEVRGSFLGFLSAEQLWFDSESGEKVLVAPGHLRRSAYLCGRCGMIALEAASERAPNGQLLPS